MASEIQLQHTTAGANLYALVRNSVGQVYNGTAFVTYATADLANYDIALTEQGTASRFYAGNFPAVAAGVYGVSVYVRAGANPAEGDALAGIGDIEWDGSAVLPRSQIAADLPQKITKGVALANFTFFMRDSADHVSGKTGLTVAATRKLDGGAFASCANAVSEVGNGIYVINLAAADLNGDVVTLRFTAAGADDTVITIPTQPT